jgi:hypothetical protein
VPSPWEDFQSSCKVLTIDICHLPSSPNLDNVSADFVDAARSYPSAPTSPSQPELVLAVQPLPDEVVVASHPHVSQGAANPLCAHERECVDFRSQEGDLGFSHPHGASPGCATVIIGCENYICGAGDGLKGGTI